MKKSESRTLFGPFKRNAISEEIVSNLLHLIRERELMPGDKLPPERELAVMMEVSRPSLREALRALSIMNVIEIRQGDGTYVSSLEPELLMSHLDFVFSLTDATFLELFEARRILEPGIVAMAASRIKDDEIQDLEACVRRSMDPDTDDATFANLDLELHETIARAAQNSILERFVASLSQLGMVSRRRTVELPGVRKQTVQDHLNIVRALQDRDPDAARVAMSAHLEHVEWELRRMRSADERSKNDQLA